MPQYTLAQGGEIVIVNNMLTPLDSRAALHFNDLENVFNELKEMLDTCK